MEDMLKNYLDEVITNYDFFLQTVVVLAVILFVYKGITKAYKECKSNYKKYILSTLSLFVGVAEGVYKEKGMGALKLDFVYNMFKSKFPITSKFITKEDFNNFVDNALISLKESIDAENERISKDTTVEVDNAENKDGGNK